MKKLNFGSGSAIKKGWDNVDVQEGKELTQSFDFNEFPYPIKDNTYDYVYLNNVLEHLFECDKVIMELRRITKPNGIIKIIVPHYTNKSAYNDLQHKRFFNEICFKNLITQGAIIDQKEIFKIVKLKLPPTKVSVFIPGKIRNKLSLFINGLIKEIDIELKVIK